MTHPSNTGSPASEKADEFLRKLDLELSDAALASDDMTISDVAHGSDDGEAPVSDSDSSLDGWTERPLVSDVSVSDEEYDAAYKYNAEIDRSRGAVAFLMELYERERSSSLRRLGGLLRGEYEIVRLLEIGPNDQLELDGALSLVQAKMYVAGNLSDALGFLPAEHLHPSSQFGGLDSMHYMYPIGARVMNGMPVGFYYKKSCTTHLNNEAAGLPKIADYSPFVEERVSSGYTNQLVYRCTWHTILAVRANVPVNEMRTNGEVIASNLKVAATEQYPRYLDYIQELHGNA